jgi:hypothetical protein
MRQVMRIEPAHLRAPLEDVIERLGMARDDVVSPRLARLCEEASTVFERTAAPRALLDEVSTDEFAHVYEGEGVNAPAAPLDEIYPRAESLALFAATLGSALDERIRDLFQRGDPSLAYVLDVTASAAADRLADLTAQRFGAALARDGRKPRHAAVLSYSPGYCGWHISGQRLLFERLRPGEIDISLTSHCLMDPIKSVSGVVIAAKASAHRFRPAYPFCDTCKTRECHGRIAAISRDAR